MRPVMAAARPAMRATAAGRRRPRRRALSRAARPDRAGRPDSSLCGCRSRAAKQVLQLVPVGLHRERSRGEHADDRRQDHAAGARIEVGLRRGRHRQQRHQQAGQTAPSVSHAISPGGLPVGARRCLASLGPGRNGARQLRIEPRDAPDRRARARGPGARGRRSRPRPGRPPRGQAMACSRPAATRQSVS